MIYQQINQWHPRNLKLGKECLILLNLANLDHIDFGKRATQLNVDPKRLREGFQDSLVNVSELKYKCNALILPYQSFFRQYTYPGIQEKPQQKVTTYQYLFNKYEALFGIGVSVPQNQYQQFVQLYSKKDKFANIKIINFNLQGDKLSTQLPILREVVSKTKLVTSKIQYHLNVVVKQLANLAQIRQQLLFNDYPIQSMSITTNLFNLLPLSHGVYGMAYYYSQIIKKYLPCSLSSILVTYHSKDPLESTNDLDRFYTIVDILSRYNFQKVKQQTKYFVTGLNIPECFYTHVLQEFNLSEGEHYSLKSKLDGIGFTQANQASLNLYKKEQHGKN